MKKTGNDLIAAVLEDGEQVSVSIERIVNECETDSAMVLSGIGMLRNTEIGYWNGSEYEIAKLQLPHELVSMSGSVADMDGKKSVHLHVALGGEDHRGTAGHLISAEVNNIIELTMKIFPAGSFGRKFSEKTKLNMLYFR